MSALICEIVYRGIFQKNLAARIARGIVLSARKSGRWGIAFGRYGDTSARAGLAQLGSRAHDLAERGLVHLVQLRHGAEDYSYFAIARPRREGALPDFASLTITEEAA